MSGIKKDCYWYQEERDMGAVIPDCRAIKSFPLTPDDCENCEKYHSKYNRTRADRVRAMTDEELAEWKSDRNQLCPPEYQAGGCPYTKSCYECWLESLKQEAAVAGIPYSKNEGGRKECTS